MNEMERGREILVSALCDGCAELFAEHGVVAGEATDGRGPHLKGGAAQMAACIGFTHPSVKGSITACMPEPFLAMTLPLPNPDAGTEELRDWAGEVANQLLGRMKNTFLRYGIDLAMGVPTIIVGTDYNVVSPRDTDGSWHSFRCGEQSLFVHLDTVIAPSIELSEPDEASAGVAAEGELFLL